MSEHEIREDVLALPEGDVCLRWPERMSAESYQDFSDWLTLIVGKLKRTVSNQSQLADGRAGGGSNPK